MALAFWVTTLLLTQSHMNMPITPTRLAMPVLSGRSPTTLPSIIIMTPVATNMAGIAKNTYSHFLIPISHCQRARALKNPCDHPILGSACSLRRSFAVLGISCCVVCCNRLGAARLALWSMWSHGEGRVHSSTLNSTALALNPIFLCVASQYGLLLD